MAAEAGDAQQADGALDQLERLDAADGLLHMRAKNPARRDWRA